LKKLTALAAAVLVAMAMPASAGAEDVFTKFRAGPIRNNKTTISDLKDWFGNPDSVKKVRRGCIRVWRVKWGDRLRVYAWKQEGRRRVAETWVNRRTLTSDQHGTLQMHTRRGLRVGNSVTRLKKLYPKAERHRFNKTTRWWQLLPGAVDPRLIAHTRDGKVIALVNAPYEYC
jgi:hypothetical protein